MSKVERDPKALLERYLQEKRDKLVAQVESDYTFEDRVVDTPNERRQYTTFFRVFEDGEVYMSRHVKKLQKFVCVNGPKAGERVTDAPGYVIYNRAYSRGSDKKAPSAVLVHLPSLQPENTRHSSKKRS